MSGEYEPSRSGTNATLRPVCFWITYGSRSCAAQLTGWSPDPSHGRRHEPGGHQHVRERNPEREQEVDRVEADPDVDARSEHVAAEDGEVARSRPQRPVGLFAPYRSQSHVRIPAISRRPQATQKRSTSLRLRQAPPSVSRPAKAAAPRTAARSGSSLIGRSPADERGGAGGNRKVPPTKTASERRGIVGETWFPPRERGPLQRPRAKPEDAQGKTGGERRSRRDRVFHASASTS